MQIWQHDYSFVLCTLSESNHEASLYLCLETSGVKFLQHSASSLTTMMVKAGHQLNLHWLTCSRAYGFGTYLLLCEALGETFESQTYSLMCFLQGTEFLMQVPVSLSTSSTITKGFSSKVTMDRWLSSSSASPKELKRGHTGYLTVRLPLSSFPI